MKTEYDIVIAGAGLAGAAAAVALSTRFSVAVLEAERPAAGASGAAAGLVNPFLGRKANPTWRMRDALAAFYRLLDAADARGLLDARGVLRPAPSPKQADAFQHTASTHPDLAHWLPPADCQAAFPMLDAPLGALHITTGGALSLPALIDRLLATAQAQGADLIAPARLVGWETEGEAVQAETTAGTLSAARLVLALGHGYTAFRELRALNLHSVKGQTITVAYPEGWSAETVPPLSGMGYAVPGADGFVIGSTYEHSFSDLAPDPAQHDALRAKAARMLPALADQPVIHATAGARVTVPGTRLPMVGLLPEAPRVWVFTGLGAKGLMMAPMLAEQLAHWFEQPDALPAEVRVRVAPGS
ncbi:MAG: FAD-binding oxidoreductase [Bacteroidota bacterium]